MTKAEFMQEMRRVEVLYRQEYSKEEAEIIFDELKGWEFEYFQKVCKKIKEKIFILPKLPDFFRISGETYESSIGEDEVVFKKLTPEEIHGASIIRRRAMKKCAGELLKHDPGLEARRWANKMLSKPDDPRDDLPDDDKKPQQLGSIL